MHRLFSLLRRDAARGPRRSRPERGRIRQLATAHPLATPERAHASAWRYPCCRSRGCTGCGPRAPGAVCSLRPALSALPWRRCTPTPPADPRGRSLRLHAAGPTPVGRSGAPRYRRAHAARPHLQDHLRPRVHGRGADALACRRSARRARTGPCTGLLPAAARARAVGRVRRRRPAWLRQRHGLAGAASRPAPGRGRRGVAVPGDDAGVPVRRGLPDGAARPQLRGQLPHGVLARQAVRFRGPSSADAAHRALHRGIAVERGGAGHRPGDAGRRGCGRGGYRRCIESQCAVRGRRLPVA